MRCIRLSCAGLVLFACQETLAGTLGTTWKQKQFLITFWCPPPATEENLARVAAEGFNLTWSGESGLDIAARHKLRVLLQSPLLTPATLDNDAKRLELDALIARVKTHPALEGYYLTDEPGAGAFAGWGRLAAHLRESDPAHFAYINLFPTYATAEQLGVSAEESERARVGYPTDFAGVKTSNKTVLRYREHLGRFMETVKPELISYDHYHFLNDGTNGTPRDGKQYFLNLGLIRLAALESGKPFLNIIQANTIEKSWRMPDRDELRWLVFTTLAYGGRGISYFTYWGPKSYGGLYQDGKPSPRIDDVVALNRELRAFGPELMQIDSLGVYQTDPLPLGAVAIPTNCPVQLSGNGEFVLGIFGNAAQPSAFMLVNRDYRKTATTTATIRIPGRVVEELDRKTGQWRHAKTLRGKRTMEIKLTPADGRLFRIAK